MQLAVRFWILPPVSSRYINIYKYKYKYIYIFIFIYIYTYQVPKYYPFALFLFWGPLIKRNSRQKGTLILKGLLRSLVCIYICIFIYLFVDLWHIYIYNIDYGCIGP